jgi:hypothetical protein
VPPQTSAAPNLFQTIDGNRSALTKLAWVHWLLAPAYIDGWVDRKDWPSEVRDTAIGKSGKLNDHAMRVWRSRLAVLASLGRPDKLTKSAKGSLPSESRPRRIDRIASDVARLRSAVTRDAALAQLRSAFGPPFVIPDLTEVDIGTAQSIGEAVQRATALPRKPSTYGPVRGFDLHVQVRDLSQQVLGDDLWLDKLPQPLEAVFTTLNAVEDTLLAGFESLQTTSNPTVETLFPVGLVLVAALRAYVTEAIASYALGCLPIQLLYWASKALGQAAVGKVRVKKVYSAYTAVGLWEAWTGRQIPHVDRGGDIAYSGPGYIFRGVSVPGLVSTSASAVNAFDAMWRDNGLGYHNQLVRRIQDLQKVVSAAPSPEAPRDKPAVKTKGDPLTIYVKQALEFADKRQRATAWLEIPALRLPAFESDAVDGVLRTTWHRGAALHAQVALFVAEQLAQRLGEAAKIQPGWRTFVDDTPAPSKDSKRKPADGSKWVTTKRSSHYVAIGDGAPRWGGNHAPHFEHRDGLVFDISIPYDYLPFRKGTPESLGLVVDDDDPTANQEVYASYESLVRYRAQQPRYIFAHDEIWRLFDSKVRDPIAGWASEPPKDEAIDELVAKLWGSPVHGDDVAPDSDALQRDLIGHVALILAGVRRWVYAGVIEHVYAAGIVTQVLANIAPSIVLEHAVKPTEFWCGADDHYNHWHVGFAPREDWLVAKRNSSPPVVDYVEMWKRLGVSLQPISIFLSQRNTSSNPGIEMDRRALIKILDAEKPAIPAGASTGDELIAKLGQAIAARKYPDPAPDRALRIARPPPDVEWQVPDADVQPDAPP